MSGDAISRKLVRDAIAAGLQAAMPAAQAVYGHQRTNFGNESPVVRVYTYGGERPQLPATGMRSRFYYTVEFWVLFTTVSGQNYEADAEDTLDQLEIELVSWLGANQIGELWQALMFEGQSVVDNVKVSAGDVWLVEQIRLVAEVYG